MHSPKPKSALACLVIFTVVMAWFSPWWAGDKVLAPLDLQNLMMSPWRDVTPAEYASNHIVSDGVSQYLVYRMVAAANFAEEGWLGWSSLTYGGTAEYANTMALYFDWTMQLHRWFDFWTAWHLGLIGQVLLAAFGMFLFLRGRGIGHLWACCGALAYAANSQFVTWIFHRWALSSFCWVPWILWAIDGYRKGRRGFWAAVPLFIAMALLGGTLQHCAIVILAVMAMWLEEAVSLRAKFKIQNSKFKISDHFFLLRRYAVWGLLGTGVAGMMLLPCIDAFLTSNRLGLHMGMNVNAEQSIYPKGPLQPFLNLLSYPLQAFPSVLGRSDSVDALKLFKSELFYLCYFGTLPVLIAYLCLFRRESPLLARLLCAAGLLLPLTPLVRYLYQRLFLLFIVGGILAFAHFMERSPRELRLRMLRIGGLIALLALPLWAAASVALSLHPTLTDQLREWMVANGAGSTFGYFTDWLRMRAERFIADLYIWSPNQLLTLALLGAGCLGLRWTAAVSASWQRKGSVLLALVVTLEVTRLAAQWATWSDPGKYPLFAETPESAVLREQVGSDGRVTTLIHPTGHMAMTPFIPNTLSPYDIATISGYDSIIPDGMILPKESPGDARKLGRLAVTHLITWTGNPDVPGDWQKKWESPMMALYENPLAVPRYGGFRDESDKHAFFTGKQGELVALEETTGLENRRNIRIPPGVRWIRVADNQAAGWQYRHAGDPSAVWHDVERASDASMLMANPAPDAPSIIEMRYNPPLRKLGFALSGLSLLLLAAGQWRIRQQGGSSFRITKSGIPSTGLSSG